ncbi:phospholipase D family protein [Mesorhizobium sp.]|uniref:phospholipase D family protein n=1 Tax=Mesorhizobium sp. TaxID=1871066 RepID=UPI000FE836D1|nr:phospholipase D family protein [Mesorhizobium sp.]RWN08827.1 MAG: hypothetical protein EOR87_21445 [Mesorhizobium sp.]RWN16252.1 MAG: hypothetical protein EOR88_17380 [Mesorhizobium sp.]
MLVEGERLKQLVIDADGEVLLCAPFIKTHVIRIILAAIPANISVRIYTRWRADEIAAGVSDLEVYDLVAARQATRLLLLDDLHAKLYVAGNRCLVGSANLTGAALGWSSNSNVELLVEIPATEPHVANLIARLDNAIEATREKRDEIAAAAALIDTPDLREQPLEAVALAMAAYPWLPRCASPKSLFAVYRNPATTSVVSGTRADAANDLADLNPPKNLDEVAFIAFVERVLEQFPSFQTVLARVPGRLSDAGGLEVIRALRPTYTEDELTKQWQIVRVNRAGFAGGSKP